MMDAALDGKRCELLIATYKILSFRSSHLPFEASHQISPSNLFLSERSGYQLDRLEGTSKIITDQVSDQQREARFASPNFLSTSDACQPPFLSLF